MSDYDYGAKDAEAGPLFGVSELAKQTQARFKEKLERKIPGKVQKLIEHLPRLAPGIPSPELDRIVYRSHAVVNQARERGYQISDRINEDGFKCYWLTGYVPRVQVTPSMKEAYYISGHWERVRTARFRFDDFACTRCKTNENLEAHHWEYDLFRERLGMLQTFCHDCHQNYIHPVLSGSSVHFPRFVSQGVGERLQELVEAADAA